MMRIVLTFSLLVLASLLAPRRRIQSSRPCALAGWLRVPNLAKVIALVMGDAFRRVAAHARLAAQPRVPAGTSAVPVHAEHHIAGHAVGPKKRRDYRAQCGGAGAYDHISRQSMLAALGLGSACGLAVNRKMFTHFVRRTGRHA